MKTLSKITTLFAILFLILAATPAAKAAPHNDEVHALQMRFLGGSRVTPGSAITAELNSNFATQATLTVENLSGKRFVDTEIAVTEGFNRVKFNVAEIPDGVYFVKVKSADKTQTLTFVVK